MVVAGLPLVMVLGLYAAGVIRPIYEAHSSLTADPAVFNDEFSRIHAAQVETKITALRKAARPTVRVERVGQELQVAVQARGAEAARALTLAASQSIVDDALMHAKTALARAQTDAEAKAAAITPRLAALQQDRIAALAALDRHMKRIHARRNPMPRGAEAERVNQLSRQVTELQMQAGLLQRRSQGFADAKTTLKSPWHVRRPAEFPAHPVRLQGWPIGAGAFVLLLGLGLWLFKGERPVTKAHGYMPTSPAPEPKPALPFSPTPLEVVSPRAETAEMAVAEPARTPDDPLSHQAAALYDRWMQLVKIVYEPTIEPPQGVPECLEPLLRDTTDFMAEGHAAMTRHLGLAATAHTLTDHVARTVIMVLLAAHEAGAGADHRQGVAMAALFHDLAVVPRAASDWAEVGSEVGRLSAAFLQKIPGLSPAMLTMAQDILVGMDDYPMNVWQNVPRSKTLESFAKLLRQTDRFDKVMQKQRDRVARRIEKAS